MIDFTGVKTLTIPEGVVVKIVKKASGAVVWEKPGVSGLPSGYTQVECIESSGTQYIDTGFRAVSDNVKIEATFSITEIKFWSALFGCEETSSGPWTLTPLVNGASALTFYNGSSSQLGSIPVSVNTVYSVVCQSNNGTLTYDCNGSAGTLYPQGAICKTDNIYIFTLNSAKGDSIISQASKMRLYYFQIYDNDVLVRDYVPCINANGEAGLYDKVNNVFYGNAGTGSFITG
jgi:hypothetical protein